MTIKRITAIVPVQMLKPLEKHPSFAGPEGPVVLVIMDRVGIGGGDVAAIGRGRVLWLVANYLHTR